MTDKPSQPEQPFVDEATGKPLSHSRRRFLAHSGMYTAGLMGSALLGACSEDNNVALADDDDDENTVTINGPSDAAVLQFALNLEYLEAEYYLRAVTGNGLDDDDTGGGQMSPGQVSVFDNSRVDFSGEGLIGRYASEIASDELRHVQFLRGALDDAGGLIARPAINLQSSFTVAARAALATAGIQAPSDFQFNPFASPTAFLIGAFIFEDVGVTAYKGGAQFIRDRDYLTAAAGILSVEGYHAGLVRTLLTQRADETALVVNGMPLSVGQVVDAISDARDQLDGDSDRISQGVAINGNADQGISGLDDDDYTVSIYGTDYATTNIVPTDNNGITFSRSPALIHNIVYLTQQSVGPSMGSISENAFFPNGTNIPANPALRVSADTSD